MSSQRVHTHEIFHGLPEFAAEGLTAIITGANGISGHYMLHVLSQSPERWKKIYCLSRRPPLIPGGLPKTAEHVAIDFLTNPDDIAKVLKDNHISADYVFFFAYLQPAPKEGKGLWSDAEEMVRVNKLLLENFIGALKLSNIKPRRFMLQTGAKNYGVHLGLTKQPQEESDPRVELEPNFYYPQEDTVFQYCKDEDVEWNVLMPGPILGAVPDAAMNVAYPLAVYATVCRELGLELEFPTDITSWQVNQSMSSAMMNAYMEEWAVLTPMAQNQRFNACDSSAFTWEGFWPKLASWYGLKWKGPDVDARWLEREVPFSPRGYGPKGVVRRKFSMVDWAKRNDVQNAWKKLATDHNLADHDLKDVDRVFGFLDGTLGRAGPLNFSMDKSRKLGWHGFVDSSESFRAVFEDLAKLAMIPPLTSHAR